MVQVAFTATRDQVFKAFPAIANLADKSDGGKITIRVEGTCEQGYDASWLRNAVDEPLDEAGIEKKPGRDLLASEAGDGKSRYSVDDSGGRDNGGGQDRCTQWRREAHACPPWVPAALPACRAHYRLQQGRRQRLGVITRGAPPVMPCINLGALPSLAARGIPGTMAKSHPRYPTTC